jgi:hypothetical protein
LDRHDRRFVPMHGRGRWDVSPSTTKLVPPPTRRASARLVGLPQVEAPLDLMVPRIEATDQRAIKRGLGLLTSLQNFHLASHLLPGGCTSPSLVFCLIDERK